MKYCHRCKVSKPDKFFHARPATHDGLDKWCRVCTLLDQQDRRAAAAALKREARPRPALVAMSRTGPVRVTRADGSVEVKPALTMQELRAVVYGRWGV